MLRELFSKEKAARGFDINLAIKSSKSGWVLGAAVGFGLEPFYPPTARFGAAGWLVVALVAVCTGVWMYILTRQTERVTRDTLLFTAYLALANIAAAQWLAGGLRLPTTSSTRSSSAPPRRCTPRLASPCSWACS
jgi:hypothetical protein